MKQLSKLVVLTLGFGLLASILSIFMGKPIEAGPMGKPVIVQNTPLPVSGDVHITNSSLPVSGTVSISNAPTVSFSNTSTTPLFVRDADTGTFPFSAGLGTTPSATGGLVCNPITVPSSVNNLPVKRLVIEYVSGRASSNGGEVVFDVFLAYGQGGGGTHFADFVPVVTVPPSVTSHFPLTVFAGPTRLYLDPGTSLGCFMDTSGNGTSFFTAEMNVSGFFVTQ